MTVQKTLGDIDLDIKSRATVSSHTHEQVYTRPHDKKQFVLETQVVEFRSIAISILMRLDHDTTNDNEDDSDNTNHHDNNGHSNKGMLLYACLCETPCFCQDA
eukprot:686554-Amphidinium_carterae.1